MWKMFLSHVLGTYQARTSGALLDLADLLPQSALAEQPVEILLHINKRLVEIKSMCSETIAKKSIH